MLRPLPGTEGALEPFWSPDSHWIGFVDATGTMRRALGLGRHCQTIATAISDPRGASWGRDDVILFGTGFGVIYVVSASGGENPRAVTQLDRSKDEGSHRFPQFLPDSQHFLFVVRTGLVEHRGVYVGSRDGKTEVFLDRHRAGTLQSSPPARSCSLMETRYSVNPLTRRPFN